MAWTPLLLEPCVVHLQGLYLYTLPHGQRWPDSRRGAALMSCENLKKFEKTRLWNLQQKMRNQLAVVVRKASQAEDPMVSRQETFEYLSFRACARSSDLNSRA